MLFLCASLLSLTQGLRLTTGLQPHGAKLLPRAARARTIRASPEDEDADEANEGPMFLMPSKKVADAMTPSEPNSFAEYLLPYAVLVGGAFLLASAAFAALVLKG